MLLRTVYTVTPSGQDDLRGADLPFEVELADGMSALVEQAGVGLRLVVHRRVARDNLEVVTKTGRFHQHVDGSREELPALRVGDGRSEQRILVWDLVSGLSFLTDVPLSVSRPRGGDRFIAEDDDDRETLDRLGTDDVYRETGGRISVRTFEAEVTPESLSILLARRAGVRLYAEALKLGADTARFRELWRVLESAFRLTDDELVARLAEYPPAQAMRFSRAELQRLLVLRNRASHAASKPGVDQLIKVERECSERLGRLKSLVERVVLTKRTWGYRTTHVEELAPLQSYVGPEGEVVYLQE